MSDLTKLSDEELLDMLPSGMMTGMTPQEYSEIHGETGVFAEIRRRLSARRMDRTEAEKIARKSMGGALHSLILSASMEEARDREEAVDAAEKVIYERIADALMSRPQHDCAALPEAILEAERKAYECSCWTCKAVRAAIAAEKERTK